MKKSRTRHKDRRKLIVFRRRSRYAELLRRQMAAVAVVMERDREVLAELAKR